MYRSEQSQKEEKSEKSKIRIDQKRVEKHIELQSKDATKTSSFADARTERTNGRKTTKTRTLYRRKKAEKQRVMALFALPRE
jgi:hypothetical protein